MVASKTNQRYSRHHLEEGDREFCNQPADRTNTISPIGIIGGLKGLADRSDSTPLLDEIRVPTLIIVGEKDELTTVDDAKRMASRIVGSKLVIVPNAGHISTLEQPEKVTSTIRSFR